MTAVASALPRLRIVMVEDDSTLRRLLTRVVAEQLGHEIVGEAATGLDMIDTVRAAAPDLIITDIHLPGLDGLAALKQLWEERPVPAVVMTADRDGELIARALAGPVMAYLVKPFEPPQLHAALQLAWARFQEHEALHAENVSLRQALEARKAIERAKGLLMNRNQWTEAEAFRRLQRTAMNRRRSMADLAQDILNSPAIDLDAL